MTRWAKCNDACQANKIVKNTKGSRSSHGMEVHTNQIVVSQLCHSTSKFTTTKVFYLTLYAPHLRHKEYDVSNDSFSHCIMKSGQQVLVLSP